MNEFFLDIFADEDSCRLSRAVRGEPTGMRAPFCTRANSSSVFRRALRRGRFLYFFLGLGGGAEGTGGASGSAMAGGLLRRWFGWGLGLNRARRRIVDSD